MEGIKAIPFRTPACDQHLPDNESDECPWCEIEQMQKVIDRTAIQRLDLESENLRLTAEYSNLKDLARRVIEIVDRDQVDIQALKAAVSGRE